MMAAARILIWLPDRLIGRCSISNMAFSPWRIFVFSAGVAPAHRRYLECYAVSAANGRARIFKSRERRKRSHADCEACRIPAGLVETRHRRQRELCGAARPVQFV